MHMDTGEIYGEAEIRNLAEAERQRLIALTEKEAALLANVPNRHERRAALARMRGLESVASPKS